jgi:uncharacterized protein YndB with AHSA1/START domain
MRHLHSNVLAVALMAATAVSAQVGNSKLSGQSFKGATVVNASSEKVWAILTNPKHLPELLEYELLETARKLDKLGSNLKLKALGDPGRMFLTYSKPLSELRFSWQPDNGTYLCQEEWTLKKSGKGTKITYQTRYTESGPQSKEDIAAQVKAGNDMLVRLKKLCESK